MRPQQISRMQKKAFRRFSLNSTRSHRSTPFVCCCSAEGLARESLEYTESFPHSQQGMAAAHASPFTQSAVSSRTWEVERRHGLSGAPLKCS